MSAVIVVRDTTATLADALAEAVTRLAGQHTRDDNALLTAWQCVKVALDQSELTNRQRELVLLDLIGLRRSQIAELMHVTPATLTTYWKAIYQRYDLHGDDARAALHRRLFPQVTAKCLLSLLNDF
jgi:DNA-binding NarL/FixJ family response regulator